MLICPPVDDVLSPVLEVLATWLVLFVWEEPAP
jgi:hypothetical protein